MDLGSRCRVPTTIPRPVYKMCSSPGTYFPQLRLARHRSDFVARRARVNCTRAAATIDVVDESIASDTRAATKKKTRTRDAQRRRRRTTDDTAARAPNHTITQTREHEHANTNTQTRTRTRKRCACAVQPATSVIARHSRAAHTYTRTDSTRARSSLQITRSSFHRVRLRVRFSTLSSGFVIRVLCRVFRRRRRRFQPSRLRFCRKAERPFCTGHSVLGFGVGVPFFACDPFVFRCDNR